MKAIFYLINLSFKYNPNIALDDIEEAIREFSDNYDYIKDNNDEIHKHDSIYEIILQPSYKVEDLYYPDKECPLSRDTKKFLLKIIDHSKNQNWTNEEILELILEQEKENLCEQKTCYGLLALLEVPSQIPEIYTIHNKRHWLNFHRYFLQEFPCELEYFIKECSKCFPSLFFHEQNINTIQSTQGGWLNFVKEFVRHLTALNDSFPAYLEDRKSYQRIEVLKKFSSENSIEVSSQGNVEDKPKMTFSFMNKLGKTEEICCEPHMKLSNSNKQGDNKYYFNRIYFHEGKENIQGGKILVGHIGKHIDF